MSTLSRVLPFLVVGVGLTYLGVAMIEPEIAEGKPRLDLAGTLIVADHGRVKPLDTLARNSLLIISSKQTFKDQDDKPQPAIQWLFEVMASNRRPGSNVSAKVNAFRIDNEQLRDLLGLRPRPPDWLYSYAELEPKLQNKEVLNVFKGVLPAAREGGGGPFEKQVLELMGQLLGYRNYAPYETPYKVFRIENDQVLALLGLEPRPQTSFRYSFEEITPRISKVIFEAKRAGKVNDKDQSVYEVKLLELARHVELYVGLAEMRADTERVIPPDAEGGEWQTFEDAVAASTGNPAVQSWENILKAYAANQPKAFNDAVTQYHQLLDKKFPSDEHLAGYESFFNHFEPFYQCSILYVVVFILALWSLFYKEPLRRSALWLGVLVLIVHSLALVGRMELQGRPPVTNLYSSAVFIGWGCVGVCLLLERLFQNGVGVLVASVLGSLTMLLAHHLAGSGDTLEMMQAVLDTNFWLATHVTCVTMGYTATLVAGFLGMVYVLLGLLTSALDRKMAKSLGQMIYGVICFATFLSFTGTVLGGIWADQSWGRFWGWDPKENGALLIVLWNALILHARWCGLAKQRGIAVLAVAGNMITGWSWFGTNQLGVGLHAYGFSNTLALVLAIGWAIHALVIAIGLIPQRYWLSFKAEPSPEQSPLGRGRRKAPVEA